MPLNVQFVTVGEEEPQLNIPPPPPPAELPVNVQFVTVGEEYVKLAIPPPKRPVLPLKVQLLTVNVEWSLRMPPPKLDGSAPLVMVRLAMVTVVLEPMWNTRPAALPLTASRLAPGPRMVTVLVTSRSPSIVSPSAATGQGIA